MTLKELLSTYVFNNAKVLTAEHNLDRSINWTGTDVSIDIKETVWVVPGQLLVFTNRAEGQSWREYIYRLKVVDAAGLLFLGEEYDKLNITQELLDACNEMDIPLVWIPTGMSVTDFCRRLYRLYFLDANRWLQQEDWLSELCHTNLIHDESLGKQCGYNSKYYFYCMMVRLTTGKTLLEDEALLKKFDDIISIRFKRKDVEVLQFIDNKILYCFLPVPHSFSELKLRSKIQDIYGELAGAAGGCKFNLYIGKRADFVEELRESFQKARITAQITDTLRTHQKIYYYSDWYMHTLLLRGPDSDLEQFMEFALGRLLDDEELIENLTTYLVYGENLKVAAEKLHVHPNTLKYRLNKITELLGCDLADTTTRFRLRMAITIYRYLKGGEKEEK